MTKDAQSPRNLVWPAPHTSLPAPPVEERFTAGAAYVDGRFCPIEEARISLLDRGFLRSDACQETISAWDWVVFPAPGSPRPFSAIHRSASDDLARIV